jgi:hypothetical protein
MFLRSNFCVCIVAFASAARHRDPLILRLLHFLDFSLESVTVPNWEFFEPSQVEQVILTKYTVTVFSE